MLGWLDKPWAKSGSALGNLFTLVNGVFSMIGFVIGWLEGWSYAEIGATAAIAWLVGALGLFLLSAGVSRARGEIQDKTTTRPAPLADADERGPAGVDLTPLQENQLYVAHIGINGDAAAAGQLRIFVVAFNASERTIFLRRIDGSVRADDVPLRAPGGRCSQQSIQPMTEFSLTLEQSLPDAIVQRIKSLTSGGRVHFYLDGLNVMMSDTRTPEEMVRLPLWAGAVLAPNREKFRSGKIAVVGG
jgi:hypothetical protein